MLFGAEKVAIYVAGNRCLHMGSRLDFMPNDRQNRENGPKTWAFGSPSFEKFLEMHAQPNNNTTTVL